MSSFNMDSILAKAEKCMNSKEKRIGIEKLVDNKAMSDKLNLSDGTFHTPTEAAVKFISVLQYEINSCGLSDGAISAINNIIYTKPRKISTNTYEITVLFAGDLSRPSLQEAKYGRIKDLAELFNDGVDHDMFSVFGEWHGKQVWSRTVIPGTFFMENAIDIFMGNYGNDYHVKNIRLRK